ncbi:hypothetical protein HORIV_26080 [Vreelandella olivaria]|uniref:Uncharacterized protein n=1 Tax=Vreelandella olivaria TaxID=390919 RepID=A0ABM7GHU0_9GAMM|nr:hypothetical protein HORIV_26080 [Halomonas olivaria]
MVMKASLQLRIGTQLTMTPQLQQAIALLQLSTLDLRQEIQQALDANPMLEQEDEFSEQAVSEPKEEEWSESIPTELSVDSDGPIPIKIWVARGAAAAKAPISSVRRPGRAYMGTCCGSLP